MSYYLDHNATTPMCNEALDAMEVALGYGYGNPSSVHFVGRQARTTIELARTTIADLIGAKTKEIVFTSGGTEANNMAIYGTRWTEPGTLRGAIVSTVEHRSILQAADRWYSHRKKDCDLTVDQDGVTSKRGLYHALANVAPPCIVSVMHANNETGVIQPIAEFADILSIREAVLLHVDACQSFGKIPVDVDNLGVDLMTISAHKIGGPKGIGALYIRDGVKFDPLIMGGHQEGNRRAGTENVAGIAGFAAAAQWRCGRLKDYAQNTGAHVRNLCHLLKVGLGEIQINGGTAARVPNTVNVRFDGVQAEALVLMLSEREIYVSDGSACESGAPGGSHVLLAMGQTEDQANSAIRFSFGEDLEEGAVQLIAKNVIDCVKLLRSMQSGGFGPVL